MDLSYWRLASGVEVDFVVGGLTAAIEVKATERAAGPHFAGLQALREDHPRVGRRVLVCLEPRRRVREDGIEVLPVVDFLHRLWTDELF
jgi:predicted AAA+ superfamily ATPase